MTVILCDDIDCCLHPNIGADGASNSAAGNAAASLQCTQQEVLNSVPANTHLFHPICDLNASFELLDRTLLESCTHTS